MELRHSFAGLIFAMMGCIKLNADFSCNRLDEIAKKGTGEMRADDHYFSISLRNWHFS